MPTVGLRGVVERLRRAADRPTCGELLDRFAAAGDGEAFAELVRRHGPKVYAVCRRVLGHRQLAEDAFQATFVVLAKKAHAVRPRSAVGGFLYGAARRAALEAFAVSRRRKETLVPAVPDTPSIPTGVEPDVLAMLDEEIANLTEPLRAAVVLCELDGVTRAAAARQLGIAEGTLSSRLAAARKQLAARLTKRGVTLSAGGFAALTASASAAPAFELTAVPPPAVSAIASGVLRTMILAKLKAAVTVGVLVAAFATWSLVPGAGPTAAAAAPLPKAKPPEGVIFVASFLEKYGPEKKGLRAFRPDGTLERDVTPDGPFRPYRVRVSPAGGWVAFTDSVLGNAPRKIKGPRQAVRALALDGSGAVRTLADDAYWPFLAWAPNSKSVYLSDVDPAKFADAETPGNTVPFRTRLIDPATGGQTPTALPPEHAVIDVSADGKTALTVSLVVGTNEWAVHLVPFATMKPETIRGPATRIMFLPRFSPDGKAVSGVGSFADPKEAKGTELYLYDVATKTESRIELPKEVAKADRLEQHAWSPDGKRVVFQWREQIPKPKKPHREQGLVLGAGPLKWYADRITACDRDGSNPVTILHADDNEEITAIEWADARLPDAKTDGPKSEAEKRVPQLGAADFAERQAAEKRLRELGPPALPALKAGLQHPDPEVVRRCEKLIDRIRTADAEAFAKAFLADKTFAAAFDHPIWQRWATTAGDDRGSRELFAELLGVDGSAAALGRLADAPADAADVYRAELRRMSARVEARTGDVDGLMGYWPLYCTVGEACLPIYLGTFAGTEDVIKLHSTAKTQNRFPPLENEPQPLYVLFQLPWVLQGPTWHPVTGSDYTDEVKKRGSRMRPAARRILVASLANRKNYRTIREGLEHASAPRTDLLPVAKAVIRNPALPASCRIWAAPILGEANATDYLPDIAALLNDETVVKSVTTPVGEQRTSQIRDIALAVQLAMHKQDLGGFGFVTAAQASEKDRQVPAWQFNPHYHNFPDDASRRAAHEKALAFLKTAPPPAADEGLVWTFDKRTGQFMGNPPAGFGQGNGFTFADPRHFLGTSPDGRKFLYAGKGGKVVAERAPDVRVPDRDGKLVTVPGTGSETDGLTLTLANRFGDQNPTDTGIPCNTGPRADQFFLSRDGKRVVRVRPGEAGGKGRPAFANSVFDLAAKRETPLDLPAECQVTGWLAGDAGWHVMENNLGADPKRPNCRWHTLRPGGKPVPVNDGYSFLGLEPSPDGTKLLGTGYKVDPGRPAVFKWFAVDPRTGAVTDVAAFENVAFVALRWSPDARRVAGAEYRLAGGKPGETWVFVADADGRNRKYLPVTTHEQDSLLCGWFPSKP